MSKEQHTRLTTKEDEKVEVVEVKPVRKRKKYRRYIPEYYLNFYEPIDGLDLDYLTE